MSVYLLDADITVHTKDYLYLMGVYPSLQDAQVEAARIARKSLEWGDRDTISHVYPSWMALVDVQVTSVEFFNAFWVREIPLGENIYFTEEVYG